LVLERNKVDSLNLIRYRIALELNPDRPEAIVRDKTTDERLMAIAASNPGHLAEVCDACVAIIGPLKSSGRGGFRHEAELADRFVIEALGHYFERLTGRRPTLSFKEVGAARPRDRYHGLFFQLCRTVFAALGKTVSSRQVFDLLRSIDVPNWKTPEKLRRPPWNPSLR
jgi:hypothetical protein